MSLKRLAGWIGVLVVSVGFCTTGIVSADDSAQTVTIGVGDTIMVVSGSTSPSANVTIIDGTSVIGSTTANLAGSYSQVFTAQDPGIHNLQVFARDTDNHLTDTVSVQVNIAEHAQTMVSIFLPPTVTTTSAQVVYGQSLLISGQTIPGGRLVITLDNNSSRELAADGAGRYSYNLATTNLSSGNHSFYLIAYTSTGDQSYPTATRTFTILPPISQAPPGTPDTAPPPPTINSPHNGDLIDGNQVTISGTAQPGAQIEIWDRGKIIGSVFADSNGKWSLTVSLNALAYEITARACVRGVCSDFSSPPISFITRRLQEVKGLYITLDRYTFYNDTNQAVTVKAFVRGGKTPYRLTFDWGDGTQSMVDAAQGETTLAHRYKKAGHYNGAVKVIDDQGATAKANFSVDIAPGDFVWESWSWLLLLGSLSLIPIWIRLRRR